MKKIMLAISYKWGWLFTFISFILALIFGVFPDISTIVRIILLTISCVVILVFVISKIYTLSYIKVPRVVGCTVAQAKRLLKDNGLNIKFSLGFEPANEQDKIVTQEPEENCYVKKNSSISVTPYKQEVEKWSLLINDTDFKILSEIQMDSNGDRYNGDFKDVKYSNGSIYSGFYKDGIPNGKGVYTAKTYEYNGDFSNALPDGKGKFLMIKDDDEEEGLTEGTFYEGDWSEGSMTGYGIHFQNGDTREGNWVDGELHGKGKIKCENGDEYDGTWEHGNMHGKGTYIWADGEKYEGDWENDNIHGKGVRIYADGSRYEGDWENDNRHGKGTYTWEEEAEKIKYEGDWHDDNRHGKGTMIWLNDGSKYEGNFKNGNRHGKGILTFGENSKFAGDIIESYFVEGSRNGQGIYKYKNGNYDIGTWKNHEKQGTFLCYNSNGQLLREEIYVEGKLKTDDHKK